jgi:hypothetical protein
MTMSRTAVVSGAALLLFAGAAAAFPISIPGLTKPKPAASPAASAPTTAPPAGLYFISQSNTTIYIIDAATIASTEAGRRTANVYVLERTGAHRRDTDDFDCKRHVVRKTSGLNFTLSADAADVQVLKAEPWKLDHADPDGSVIRHAEDFVCRWPSSAGREVLLSDIPDDEHARMVNLGTSAQRLLK